jgi:adenine-specific DNA-methyltransferase
MVKKGSLDSVLKSHPPATVEKHLVHSFLESSRLPYLSSPILTQYLKGFKPNPHISSGLRSIQADSIQGLENGLELIIPGRDRKLNGAFFTPAFIVDFMIREIGPGRKDCNLDPSCGSGAFLVGLARHYSREFKQSVRQTVRENLFGSDILDYNIRRAQLVLTLLALQQGEHLKPEDFNLWIRDSLSAGWNRKFDNILGNPPYVRFQDLSLKIRKNLAGRWKTIHGGNFNLYFAFFELGQQLLGPKGKLAYITPNNYFTSLSAEALRHFFQEKKCVQKILDFGHLQLFDARSYTAITFLNRGTNPYLLFDRIRDFQTPVSFLENSKGSPNRLSQLNAKKWRLLKTGERKNISRIESRGIPLGELFEISAGIATLKDEIFLLDGRRDDEGDYLKQSSKGIFKIEKSVTRPVYKISEFKNQQEEGKNLRRIICPYRIRRGTAVAIPEREFKEQYPHCFQYLSSEKQTLLSRDKGKVDFDPFFAWGRTQGLVRFGKRIMTPTFSQYPRFLLGGNEKAYFTNGYGLFPRKENPFPSPSSWATQMENLDIVLRILNSVVMHYYIRKTSVEIQGGYPCYQKNFIERFNLPGFSQGELDRVRSFRDKKEIDEWLCRKYGVELGRDFLKTAP